LKKDPLTQLLNVEESKTADPGAVKQLSLFDNFPGHYWLTLLLGLGATHMGVTKGS
jgi:hypothetical protein